MKLQALVALAAAALFAPAAAECPNQCSGHGRCTVHPMSFSTASNTVPSITVPSGGTYSVYGYDTATYKKDSCTCFTRNEDGATVYAYKGADCSQRTCPHGKSWATAPNANNVHDIMTECSGRGLCDTSTGTCNCFPGYTGKGCRRAVCQNDCSGHGKCKSLKELAKLASENDAWDAIAEFDQTTITYSSAWDAENPMAATAILALRALTAACRSARHRPTQWADRAQKRDASAQAGASATTTPAGANASQGTLARHAKFSANLTFK
eukprot:CAMPEP_0171473094 /NCGR_PEP_ID=MMETSP0946-20130122/1643_1 /TAXON_ID=109269 /ORGANISM="Vaucheria litorea, Strain CCMP2940" /LENGTH=266 /DNA_ID=CAMNT_0012002805 /DNA_START=114 /DNA_END=912 /DNA_ORIENTATION=-